MGTAESIATPPNPSEYEWWGMGPAIMFNLDQRMADEGKKPASRYLSRWYEIHDPEENRDGSPGFRRAHPEYWEWLKTLDCPVYMNREYPEIPNSVAFPFEKLRAIFGDVFGGSASWMTGQMIAEHCEGQTTGKVNYVGVHLSQEGEYHDEARGLCFLMGWASGRGIQVNCFDVLLPKRSYAYHGSDL